MNLKYFINIRVSKKEKKIINYVDKLFGVGRGEAFRKALRCYWIPKINEKLREQRQQKEENDNET